jgi:hypothetical protein
VFAEVRRFLRSQRGEVHQGEERMQPAAYRRNLPEQCPCLNRVRHRAAVHLMNDRFCLGNLDLGERVRVEHFLFDGEVERVRQRDAPQSNGVRSGAPAV